MMVRPANDPLLPDAILLEVAGGEIMQLYAALAQALRWHLDRAALLEREAEHFEWLAQRGLRGRVSHIRLAGERRREASGHRTAANEVDSLARVVLPYTVQ